MPLPLLTALSCLETPHERKPVVNDRVVDQSPQRLRCCVFNSSPLRWRAQLGLPVFCYVHVVSFFPCDTPRHWPHVEIHIWSISADMCQNLFAGFPAISIAKRVNLKLTRQMMTCIWCISGTLHLLLNAVLLIVLRNLLRTLMTETNSLCLYLLLSIREEKSH